MPLLRDTQATFGGGELTPGLWGRTDIQKYKTGLRAARNGTIIPQGGFRNRPGTAYIAKAGNSSYPVRVIPFIASTSAAYIIELGNYYARFYTADAQVQVSVAAAWVTSTAYVVGNYVSNGGQIYYCLVSHTSGTFATDLAAGKWVQQTAYQIPTPWAATDIFKIKLAQSADVMYFAHPNYPPQQLTFTSASNWTLAQYSNINGPFQVQNTLQSSIITPTVALWVTAKNYAAGQYVVNGINPSSPDLIDNFSENNYNNWTLVQDSTAGIVYSTAGNQLQANPNQGYITSDLYRAVSGAYGTFCASIWNSSFYFAMASNSTDEVNAFPNDNGYALVSSNNGQTITLCRCDAGSLTALITVNGLVAGIHYVCAFRHSTTGAFTLYIDGVSSGTATDNTYVAGSYWHLYAGVQSVAAVWTNLFYATSGTAAADYAANQVYRCLIQHTSDTFSTDLAAGKWVATNFVDGAGISLLSSSAIFNSGQVGGLFQIVNTIVAQTQSVTFTTNLGIGAAIPCGPTWSIITAGTWTGKIIIQVSIDNGQSWTPVQTLQSVNSLTNYQTSGSTGFSQCLIRVVGDGVTSWSGTLTANLTCNSFDWISTVQITAVTDTSHATATVQIIPNSAYQLYIANTYQWSEGSWSTYRGFPTCVTFYQDRSVWSSTKTEPNTAWHSKTASYADFGVSQPTVASDGFSVVLASRQLNAVNFLIPMPQALVAGSTDNAFGLSPGVNGIYSSTSITQQPMDHRGSYNVDPVVVGNEIILIQQMGTVLRNLIFQLAVNGFMGDDISISSQHLFTGYSIVQMAYQQEPDSIIWAVRSDGILLSCTYNRAQEMNAWTRNDTMGGLFESVACIPNATLGINEVWFVVNRGGTRYIEALKPRDQGTTISAQWFMDCGTQYSGSPATVISNIPLPNGTVVAVLADGNVVANGINDVTKITVQSGSITIPYAASVVTVGIPIVWDVGLLDMETPNQGGSLQGKRVTQPRGKIRCWNSRGGYISLSDPASTIGLATVNGGSFDAIADLMLRDPSVNMDTALPLVTSIVDIDFPSDYSYGSHVCLRGIDPLPFTLLDVIVDLVPGGN